MADRKPERKDPAKKASHDDEVVGKAYDGRLMRRLLKYLNPYKPQVVLSAVSILIKAGADVLGPYFVKVAVDRYMSATPPEHLSWLPRHLSTDRMTGIGQLAGLYFGALFLSFVLEFIRRTSCNGQARRSCSTCAVRSFAICSACHPPSSITTPSAASSPA